MSSDNSNSTNATTGMISGHAQYVKGAAEVSIPSKCRLLHSPTLTLLFSLFSIPYLYQEAIGNVTGAQDWKDSGAQDKSAATDAIRDAAQNLPDNNQEGIAGKAGKLAEQGEHQFSDMIFRS